MTIYSHILYSKLLLLHAEEAILNNVTLKKIRQQIICFAIAFERNYVHILSLAYVLYVLYSMAIIGNFSIFYAT